MPEAAASHSASASARAAAAPAANAACAFSSSASGSSVASSRAARACAHHHTSGRVSVRELIVTALARPWRTISRAARSSSPRRCASSAKPCKPCATPVMAAGRPGAPRLQRLRLTRAAWRRACGQVKALRRRGDARCCLGGASVAGNASGTAVAPRAAAVRRPLTWQRRTRAAPRSLSRAAAIMSGMEFSVLHSVPRIVAFYAAMLLLFYPAMALIDRLRGKRVAKKA